MMQNDDHSAVFTTQVGGALTQNASTSTSAADNQASPPPATPRAATAFRNDLSTPGVSNSF